METVSIIWILYPIVSKLFPKNGNGFQKSWIRFPNDGNIWKYFMEERMYPKWINVRVLTGGLCCVAVARRAKPFCQKIWDLLKNAGRRELSDCELCEAKADIQFKPCGHRVCCGSCSSGWSKCVCGAKIEEKSDVLEDPRAFDEALKNEGGSIRKLVQNAGRQIDREKEELAREKEELIREKEELIDDRRCAICLDFPKSYVFASCGHSACSKCQTDLQVCHVCRTQIRDKIRFF